ncbi:N-acetylmuramic acid 6-phosphate etherase [Effusibacillus lacus]|uniref:N-acetylmuramic acid 6-phosphate etherase n=1 Tax=Effusibacillus lacus TaxID=1348429 RepID=A0A292YS40_9BACL|nr:N-acetylmuramic acid 6-phosphate etherase [Effusibacillus lacus]TCS75878.1 N-acetylmuramic acid 6-phosphate etherase [Effusibacillus lacus]GAX91731.1 N-acetylmuramic acid 6-phosphate etherase [Effusibacillus lacus]
MESIANLATEQQNEKSARLDEMSALEIVTLINGEDQTVAQAVGKALPSIAEAVEVITKSLSAGGRLIYVGAGTSGRLGVLDASECPPTFSVERQLVQAILAGGRNAMFEAIEGAEDDMQAGGENLKNISLSNRDVVVGISASGRTPYVIGALKYAKQVGASAIALSCNLSAKCSEIADVAIEVETGPEVLAGSTRMKAGTAQKMVLNMLSTASMVRLGKVYKNLMIDVKPTNEKLVDRARRILMKAAGVSYDEAAAALQAADNQVKVALVIIKTGLDAEEAKARLKAAGDFVRPVIEE